MPTIFASIVLGVSGVSAAQGFEVIDGSYGAFVGTERRVDRIHLGETLELNITVKSLYADECRLSMGLEVEAVTQSWQDETLGRLVNGSALVETRSFVFPPNGTMNVLLEWNTSGLVTLDTGHRAHAQRGEYHLEFERDNCDGGGGGAVAIALFEVPQNFTVTCPRIQLDFMGTCRAPQDVGLFVLGIVGLIILAVAVPIFVIRFLGRRGRPPDSESGEGMPPAMPPT